MDDPRINIYIYIYMSSIVIVSLFIIIMIIIIIVCLFACFLLSSHCRQTATVLLAATPATRPGGERGWQRRCKSKLVAATHAASCRLSCGPPASSSSSSVSLSIYLFGVVCLFVCYCLFVFIIIYYEFHIFYISNFYFLSSKIVIYVIIIFVVVVSIRSLSIYKLMDGFIYSCRSLFHCYSYLEERKIKDLTCHIAAHSFLAFFFVYASSVHTIYIYIYYMGMIQNEVFNYRHTPVVYTHGQTRERERERLMGGKNEKAPQQRPTARRRKREKNESLNVVAEANETLL
eukprot:gene6961-4927_t